MGKASKLRAYGFNAWAPNHWPIEPSPNGNRQRSAVVAASSTTAALRAFAESGVEITAYQFREYGYPDTGGIGAELALAHPGRVFYRPRDMRGEYVPAPDPHEAV